MLPELIIASTGIVCFSAALCALTAHSGKANPNQTDHWSLMQCALGAMLGYSTMFLFFGVPSIIHCQLRQIFAVLSYSLVLGALMTMSWRTFRNLPRRNRLDDPDEGWIRTLPSLLTISLGSLVCGLSLHWSSSEPVATYTTPISISIECQSDIPTLVALGCIYLLAGAICLALMMPLAHHPNFKMDEQMVLLAAGKLMGLTLLVGLPQFSQQLLHSRRYLRTLAIIFAPSAIVGPLLFFALRPPQPSKFIEPVTISEMLKSTLEATMGAKKYPLASLQVKRGQSSSMLTKKPQCLVLEGGHLFLSGGQSGDSEDDEVKQHPKLLRSLWKTSGNGCQGQPNSSQPSLAKQMFIECSTGVSATLDVSGHCVSLKTPHQTYALGFAGSVSAEKFFERCFEPEETISTAS
ncbi:uncharacterized protein BJ171DRAFT_514782 [Polychytrium aggregatum]|uniref:uncharacterized protein n=1 Tax=Polychytrium aggregatum TaxID=110093 RepID=UPI0022FF44F0|nr:uncharacterized protein BJ171DRAFT_514782 [Polychytrium aggregatum]KAI9202364.1 hypothetical protein BJ171DRAFT_514782 [Polychytrium aggregatum]